MTAPDLSHIDGIIWDLDNTLYRYNDAFLAACNIAAANQVIAMGLDMKLDEAIAMATESEKQFGSSFRLFADLGFAYRDFHFPYHDAVDTTILEQSEGIKAALESLDVPMVILTNASKNWARKTIAHIELDHVFSDTKIITLEDVDFKAKAYHPDGFERGLSLLGTDAARTLMVDDLARNLPVAKQLGLTTALVHQSKQPQAADHVDVVFETTLELTQTLMTVRR